MKISPETYRSIAFGIQAFYVYTSGFFSLLEEIFRSSPNRAVLLGRVWSSFATLMERVDAGERVAQEMASCGRPCHVCPVAGRKLVVAL